MGWSMRETRKKAPASTAKGLQAVLRLEDAFQSHGNVEEGRADFRSRSFCYVDRLTENLDDFRDGRNRKRGAKWKLQV